MRIIVKGKGRFKVHENLRRYAEGKVRKYQNLVKEPAVSEIVFEDLRGSKDGIDKAVSINMTMPEIKNPIFVQVTTSDFFGSVDLAQDRLEQQIHKYKERKKIGSRFPAKYWLEKVFEAGVSAPRRLFKEFRKRSR